jgi:hypothetical protein
MGRSTFIPAAGRPPTLPTPSEATPPVLRHGSHHGTLMGALSPEPRLQTHDQGRLKEKVEEVVG